MPFTEDLSVFFDTSFAGTQVEIRNKAGAFVRNAVVILGAASEELHEGGEIVAGPPQAMGRAADLSDLRRDFTLTAGSVTYVVTGPPRDDGTGLTTVGLRKQ